MGGQYGTINEGPSHGQNLAAFIASPAPVDRLTVPIDPDGTDVGNTDKEWILRAGLVLGKVTATGLYREYDDGNNPAGIGVAVGVLLEDVNLKDALGNAVATAFGVMALPPARLRKTTPDGEDCIYGLDSNGESDLETAGFTFTEDL